MKKAFCSRHVRPLLLSAPKLYSQLSSLHYKSLIKDHKIKRNRSLNTTNGLLSKME